MKRMIAALLASATVVAFSGAIAQERVPIQFESGQSSMTVNGTIRGQEYIDYVVRARAHQTLTVSVRPVGTNGDGTIYFNILSEPQNDRALFVGSTSGRSASVLLPDDGLYAVRVYLMGNDRDADRTVGFSLPIYITGPAAHSGGNSAGDADWYTRLVGAAGDGAANQLRQNGFRQVDTFESGTNAYGTVWYNGSSRQCLQVIVVNGRVDSSRDIQTHPNCR